MPPTTTVVRWDISGVSVIVIQWSVLLVIVEGISRGSVDSELLHRVRVVWISHKVEVHHRLGKLRLSRHDSRDTVEVVATVLLLLQDRGLL